MLETKKIVQNFFKGKILWNEPMKKHTSFGIGGPALAVMYPEDEFDLSNLLKTAKKKKINIYFTGSGSNILVNDKGFNGFVISLSKSFKKIDILKNKVFCESGVMMGSFVKKCTSNNLTGMESLIGVPGTVGGAIKMNAGAWGMEISNYIKKIKMMNSDGEIIELEKNEIEFGYRFSSIKNDLIISSNFEFKNSNPENIKKLKLKASNNRKNSQPLKFRSAGSVFKNPKNFSAGYLIDKAGLKGVRVGDAEISKKHANFFLNLGNASSNDIVKLILLTKKKVKEKFDINLELEIKTMGFKEDFFKNEII